jgi:ferritin-like metal-binding protein YciE
MTLPNMCGACEFELMRSTRQNPDIVEEHVKELKQKISRIEDIIESVRRKKISVDSRK